MHELSIATGIVRIAEENCRKAHADKVDVIELQIGELAGIEKTSLEFAWPMAVKNTKLESAEKEIEWVQGTAKCVECNKRFGIETLFDPCPGKLQRDGKSYYSRSQHATLSEWDFQ